MTVAHDAATEPATFGSGAADPYTFAHTPSGTPKGVLVFIDHGSVGSDLITSVSYGGLEMTRVQANQDAATEPGRSYIYFLGKDVPAGTQTVSIDHTGGTTVKHAVCCTVTAATHGTALFANGGISGDALNPQVALDTLTKSGLRYCVIYSGLAAPTSLTLLADHTAVHNHDFGAFCSRVDRQTTASTGSFTIGYTAVIDDVAMSAVAVVEITELTGAAGGVSALSADATYPRVTHPLDGTVAGVAGLAGDLFVDLGTIELTGAAAGISTLAGALAVEHPLAGSAAGVSSLTGDLIVAHDLTAASNGVSSLSAATGQPAVEHSLVGSIAGVSNLAGDLAVALGMIEFAGIVNAVSTFSVPNGQPAVDHMFAGSASCTSTLMADTGQPVMELALSGNMLCSASLAAVLGLAITFSGTTEVAASVAQHSRVLDC